MLDISSKKRLNSATNYLLNDAIFYTCLTYNPCRDGWLKHRAEYIKWNDGRKKKIDSKIQFVR